MRDFQRGMLAAKEITINYFKYFSWTTNMRLLSRKKPVVAALVIVTTALMVILFSSGKDSTDASATRKAPQYNYDVLQVLRRFSILAKERNIVVCLIEPHILLSMLSREQQQRLSLRTGFSFSAKNKNVVTVAVQGKSGWKLSQNAIKTAFESASFSHVSVMNSPRSSLSNHLIKSDLPTHHFYIRHRVVIHVVVFYQKSHYFWHSKLDLPMEVAEELRTRDLFFADSDSMYDSFSVVPMSPNESYQGLHVPSNIQHFLSEIPTSQMIECRSQTSARISDLLNTSQANVVVPPQIFQRTADSFIGEMKSLMDTYMAPFWLASGTLLGWYRDCGIIPYTNDMDFATWSSDLNIVLQKDFEGNPQIKLLSTLGQNDEDLEFWLAYKWLRVDLFFTYETGDHFYVGGHNPSEKYSFRYLMPRFDLCSGDFLGHKVLVPCQVESVLEAEYGSGWLTPIASWNYEISARNIMGRRYWNKDEAFSFIKQISSLSIARNTT